MTTAELIDRQPDAPSADPVSVDPVSAATEPADRIGEKPESGPTESGPVEPGSDGVSTLHRAIAVLALISLFVGTATSWASLIWPQPGWAAVIMVGYGVVLVLAVCALTVRRRHLMVAVDVGVLLVTFAMRVPAYFTSFPATSSGGSPYPNDEGPLVDTGAAALSHGLDPYNVIWAEPLQHATKGVTQTMAGGVVSTYDYPPLPAVFDYLLRPLSGGVPAAAVTAMVALALATVVMFLILPTPWRSAAPMLLLGLDLMPSIARDGYPMIMMLPFLLVAGAGWARIGRAAAYGTDDRGGRLGWRGWSGAICLGIAASVQPLAWFVAPFLIVGLLVVRLGDLPRARAWWLTARYATIAFVVFLAVNLPFVIADASTWWRGILLPLTDTSVPHGQGLVGISYYLVGGSGYMSGYSNGAIALLGGLVIASVLFMRRLGPAVLVLPWITFYLALRSQDNYFLITAPLWIISLATLKPADFARAWQPWSRVPWPRIRAFAQVVTFVALLIPAAAFVTSATTSPQPLRMSVESLTVSKVKGNVHAMTIRVTNVSSATITPHFALSSDASMSRFFVPVSGPVSLPPGDTATYELVPWQTSTRSVHDRVVLRATSTSPLTLSSTPLD